MPYTGVYYIAKFDATTAVTFDLFVNGASSMKYVMTSSSIPNGGDAVGAFTVGAINWNTGFLESFSSQGPTSDCRTKPDISGPDGVTATALPAFFETSAAAPHVAGVAALAKAANPAVDADDLQSMPELNAVPNHAKTNQDGTGWSMRCSLRSQRNHHLLQTLMAMDMQTWQ